MKTQKMAKTARTLERVFKVLQCVAAALIAVAAVFLGIFAVMYLKDPGGFAALRYSKVSVGPISFELSPEAAPVGRDFLLFVLTEGAGGVIYASLGIWVLGIFRRILRPMAEGAPFDPTVSRELRHLAFISLAVGVVENIFSNLEALNAIAIFDLGGLLQGSVVRSVTVGFRLDVTFVVIFFGLLLLSYIFRYGEELQKLSDETL